MDAKEKAKQLLEKIDMIMYTHQDNLESQCKHCALIAVMEIINSNPHSNPLNTEVFSTMEYWQEVKHEIEKR